MIWRGASALAGAALGLAAPLAGADWRERLALAGPAVAPGGIWLHAASVGELTSDERVVLDDEDELSGHGAAVWPTPPRFSR